MALWLAVEVFAVLSQQFKLFGVIRLAVRVEYVVLPDFRYWIAPFRAPWHVRLRPAGHQAPVVTPDLVFGENRQDRREGVA